MITNYHLLVPILLQVLVRKFQLKFFLNFFWTLNVALIKQHFSLFKGLSLLAESASRLPLTADRPNMREQLLAKAVEKKQVHL